MSSTNGKGELKSCARQSATLLNIGLARLDIKP